MNRSTITIRAATECDTPLILEMIRELAEFEQLSHEVTATEDRLRRDFFGKRPYAEVLIGCVDGTPAGMAIFLHNYSTFLAEPGMYLEDLYVRTPFRRLGLGRRLLTEVGRIAADRGCGRYEWSVLNWNSSAIQFYESLGAVMAADWRRMRVEGRALQMMAADSATS